MVPHVSSQGISVLHEPTDPRVDIVFVHGFTGHPESTWALERAKGRKRQRDEAAPKQSKFPRMSWRRASRKNAAESTYSCEGAASVNSRVVSFSAASSHDENTQSPDSGEGGAGRLQSISEDVYWPYHLLPTTIPTARILTYGYDTRIRHIAQGPVSQNTVHDHAWDLLCTLEAKRRSPRERQRPLIFVAHSLGGLVVKEMLKRSNESGSTPGHQYLHDVFLSTTAILFFGTPHRGADPRAFLHHVLSVSAQGLGVKANDRIVAALMPQTERRPDAATFAAMACQQQWIIYSFQEEYGVPGLFGRKVVDSHSSCLDLPFVETVQHISDNHMDMCRFHGLHDSGYQKVSAAFDRILAASVTAGPVSQPSSSPLGPKHTSSTPPPSHPDASPSHPPSSVPRSEPDLPTATTPPPHEAEDVLTKEQITRLIDLLRFDQIDARLMNLRSAQRKTCDWFLSRPEYIDWMDSSKTTNHGGLLWIKGKPGAGKSIMMKFLFSEAQRSASRKPRLGAVRPLVVSFFFNARGDQLERSTLGCYRSLLLQLFEKDPKLHPAMDFLQGSGVRLTEVYGWNTERLTQTLIRAVSLLKQPVSLFIDALDECDEAEVREMVAFFEQLGESAVDQGPGSHFNICFSSRHYPSIVPKKGIQMTLEDQAEHHEDISRYADAELRLGDSYQTAEIKAEILRRCSNVFLWAALVIPILNREYANGRMSALRKRLNSIPPGLDDVFDMILTRDDENADELSICLQWILFASSPLTPQELYIAVLLGLDQDCDTELDPKQMSAADHRRYVDSASKGLAEVTRSKKPTVQFIHESVRDFLLGKGGRRNRWAGFGKGFAGKAHELLKTCCFSQLKAGFTAHFTNVAWDGEPDHDIKEPRPMSAKYPFLRYAISNVLYHSDQAEQEGVSQLDYIETFPLPLWIRMHNLFEQFQVRKYAMDTRLLYLLAERNLARLIRIHPDRSEHLGMVGGRYGYPILAAIALRNAAALEELMSAIGLRFTSAFTEDARLLELSTLSRSLTFSNEKRDLITYLVEFGHMDLLKKHLSALREAQPPPVIAALSQKHGPDNRSALFWARSKPMVEFLLSHGLNPNDRDNKGHTPLQVAVEAGSLGAEMIESLCAMEAVDVNARDLEGKTALHHAAQASPPSAPAFRALLESPRVEINAQDLDGFTALHALLLCTKMDRETLESAKVLVSGADFDPNIQSTDGQTALHVFLNESFGTLDGASLALWRDICSTVITHPKFNPNVQDARGLTCMHCLLAPSASCRGDLAVATMLMKSASIDLNVRLKYTGESPLHFACQLATDSYVVCESAVGLILEHAQVDINLQDKNGNTALHFACSFGAPSSTAVAYMLLDDARLNPNLKNRLGQTPLHNLIRQQTPYIQDPDAIQRYVSLPTIEPMSHVDFNSQTVLHTAVQTGHVAMVTGLLSVDWLDADSRDQSGSTPLMLAASANMRTILELLIESGKVQLSPWNCSALSGLVTKFAVGKWTEVWRSSVLTTVVKFVGGRLFDEGSPLSAIHSNQDWHDVIDNRPEKYHYVLALLKVMAGAGLEPPPSFYGSMELYRLLGRVLQGFDARRDTVQLVLLVIESGHANVSVCNYKGESPLELAKKLDTMYPREGFSKIVGRLESLTKEKDCGVET